jgi:ASC-1-like (ASCH) protein
MKKQIDQKPKVGVGVMVMKNGKNKILKLKFRAVDRDIFEAIRSGKKKVETRAGTEKYKNIKPGDKIELICRYKKFEKEITKVQRFKTIRAMLKKYKPVQISPFCKTEGELRDMYYSFPEYKEKLRKYGLVAFELK